MPIARAMALAIAPGVGTHGGSAMPLRPLGPPVGDDPASQIYVRNKERAGTDAGLRVKVHRLPAATTVDALLEEVRSLNADPECDGILVQAPLPAAIGKHGTERVFDAMASVNREA